MLFVGSSVLLVLLHRAQARAQANAPYTLTPPIMVRPSLQLRASRTTQIASTLALFAET